VPALASLIIFQFLSVVLANPTTSLGGGRQFLTAAGAVRG
jgi:hypothetical protein